MIDFDNRQNKVDITDEIYSLIQRSIESTLSFEGFDEGYELSLVLTDNEGIREINREHRNIDRETDVLSFPMLEFEEGYFEDAKLEVGPEDRNPETGDVILGDIVISLEKAESQAKEYGHSIEREIAFLTVHSCLHLLGYDHEEEADRIIMREKEEEILSHMGLIRQ